MRRSENSERTKERNKETERVRDKERDREIMKERARERGRGGESEKYSLVVLPMKSATRHSETAIC